MTDQDLCAQVTDAMTEVLEGSASDALYDHIASCDRCRDARHDAAQLTEMLADASLDYVHPEDFEARVTTALDAGAAALDGPAESEAELARGGEHLTGGARAAITERVATTRREARGPRGPLFGGWLRKPRNTLIAGAAAAALAAAGVALVVGPPHPTDEAPVADLPWGGKVARVARAAGGEGGLQICVASQCRPAQAGETIPAGATLETDDRTRAHVTLGDGTELALDRQTELRFESDRNRTATLSHGAIVAEVSKVEGKPAWLRFPLGAVEVLGTKLALRASDSGASVDVSRGKVRLRDVQERSVEVRAGEEGRLYPDAPPYAMAAPSLGDALSWSEDAGDERDLRGLGELKAKKPGEQDERKGAVELASHRVKVRIVDGFARTEVEEVFTNQTNEVLEGIYRFPMPPDAQIERLALQVDDHFEEGAFVDRDRAAAIWRGAIVNASRRAPLPRDEIVWVPGPWRDPALLEWQRGGRFELRIFPIPAKGSRKVVLTYTQVVSPTGDRRRYTYPLAHDPSGNLTVDAFDVDIEVRGHDASRGVQAAGYALSQGSRGDATTLTMASTQFVPTGDLVVEYATAQSGDLSAFAYAPSVDGATASDADDVQKKAEALAKAPQGAATARDRAIEAVEDGRGYVAFTVRPELPQRADDAQRAYVFVVDSSRSMYGERHKRAADVTARVIDELDRLDQFAVLSCDTTCRPMPGGLRAPSRAAAAEAQAFIEGIDPEGGSDPAAAIRDAGAFASQADGRSLRVVYVGDGTPTVGPIRPAYLRRAVEDVLPPGRGTLTAVAIGADADLDSLAAMARGGGGSVLPYVPGQRVGEAAYAVLGATYGSGLRDVSVTLPEGLVEMAPERVDTIVAGGEAVLAARMTRPHVEGDLVLRGKVGNEPFEARYPITVTATSDAGNAFVPRLYAAARIAELERETGAEARAEAVALSSAFNVASRHTSLLVLESPAMFRAFGLDNQRRVAEWTGDVTAVGSTAEDALAEDKKTAGHGDADDYDGEAEAQLGSGFGGPAPSGTSALADRFDDEAPIGGTGASMPRAKVASRPLAQTETPPPAPPRDFAKNKDEDAGGWRERRRGGLVPMRRVFERQALIDISKVVPTIASPSAIVAAEAELAANDNRRGAVKDLYRLYALAGDLERAQVLADRWSEKEALDPEALTARADLAARRGDREAAIRILGSVVDVRPGEVPAQERLARLHRWAGREALGCRHAIAISQLRPGDAKLLAEAVGCGRRTGESRLVEDMLASASETTRAAAQRRLDSDATRKVDKAVGDIKVTATWEGGGHDLDLALIHPDGHRVSWLGAPTRALISAEDVTSFRGESLGLLGSRSGEYVLEVVRASGEGPVRGEVVVTAAGNRRVIPFVLDGQRRSLGTIQVFFRSRLVPF